MKTLFPGALASVVLSLAVPMSAASAQINPTDCDPVDLQWSQSSYTLGEGVSLEVTGTPTTFGIMYVNSDPGPLVVPGLGTFGVGAGPGLISFGIKPLPASGSRTYTCFLECDGPFYDQTFYVQALTVSPNSDDLCISNVAPLVITDEACVAEGCTPGLWKNKTVKWVPTGYDPADDFDSVFGVDLFDPDITLLDAVEQVGMGKLIFSAHATAALLNATHPDIDYPLTEAQIIQMVQDAVLADDLEPLKDKLDMFNNSGCPL